MTTWDEYTSLLSSKLALGLLALVVILTTLTTNYFHHGLNKYPAPFPAAFTDMWRFLSVYRGKPQFTLRKLHEQHGDIVRVGPNSLSFSHPDALKAIYGLKHKLTKVC